MFKASIFSLTACLAGLTLVGCASDRRAAEAELVATRDALAAVDAQGAQFVVEEVAAIQEAIDSVAARIERKEYRDALTAAQLARTTASDLPNVVVARRAELDAAWTLLRDSLPQMLQQADQQVNRMSSARRLPTGVTRSQVDDAKTALLALNETWAQAVREFEEGKLPGAVSKAESVESGVAALMSSLGQPTS